MSLINRDSGRLCFKSCPDNELCLCRDRVTKPERKMVMWTGCSTYGMIEANKYCDDLQCTNCTRRAQEFCDALDKIVKNGYPNISDNGQ